MTPLGMGVVQIDAFMTGQVPLGRVTCPARILTHDTKRLTHTLLTSSRADNGAMWVSQAFMVSKHITRTHRTFKPTTPKYDCSGTTGNKLCTL